MKKLLFILLAVSLLTNSCGKSDNQKAEVNQKKYEHWANFDDELDVKSVVTIDTALFRREMNSLLPSEKIFDLFGSGFHNLYLALTISKENTVQYTLGTDVSLWFGIGGPSIDELAFEDGNNSERSSAKTRTADHEIFNLPIADTKKIFTAKSGEINNKPVRTIKLYDLNITIDKNKKIVKPWAINETDVKKYRPQFVDKTLNRYYFTTGLPAISIDGFDAIRKAIVYPEKAVKNNITGRVIVEIFADQEGNYAGYQLLKGLGYGCDESVINAIKNAKFRGYPTGQRSCIIVPFEFGPPKTSPVDLAVQVFDYNPDASVYNNMKLGIVNKNKLDKNLDKNYFVYVYINGYLVFQTYCTGISKADTQQMFWFRWRPEKPGKYDYAIYIDPESRVNDSNRENNTVRGTLVVK